MFHCALCLVAFAAFALGDGVAQVAIGSSHSEANQVTNGRKVAVIGAGITGASAAYHLRERNPDSGLAITIYEKNHQVGGRIKSTKVYDGAYGSQQVETGAHSFYADDECVQDLIDETGLRSKLRSQTPVKKTVGVWDGRSFLLRAEGDLKARTWRERLRYTWRYGLPKYQFDKWVAKKLPPFQRLLGPYRTIHRNISTDIEELGLIAEKRNCARHCLRNVASPAFSREVVEATTRAWNAQDLTSLNGLASLVAMNPALTNSMAHGQNQRLIDRLVKLADVDLRLNSTVTGIKSSAGRKYRLTVQANEDQDQPLRDADADFDSIIIAAPLQMAKLEFDIGGVSLANALSPYVARHVTHFTSPEPDTLSPAFFNVSTVNEIPETIFTAASNGVLNPEFFSIESSHAHFGRNGCVLESEHLYKVVSAAPLEDAMILRLLGKRPNSSLEANGIQWVHRQAWHHAFPEHSKHAMLDDVEIADSIFYTGAGEEIASSLEISCRMGRLAANLLHYSYMPPLEV